MLAQHTRMSVRMEGPVEDEGSIFQHICNQLEDMIHIHALDAQKCGLPTNSNIIWETVKNTRSQAHPRPDGSKSEF